MDDVGCALSEVPTARVGRLVARLECDFVASRRETALALGADVVVDPKHVSPYAAWRELAYGKPEPVKDMMNPLDLPRCVVFEFAGVPAALDATRDADGPARIIVVP